MNWPSFFPPNCPPPEAKDASGTVYRFVKNNPPLAEDFLTHKHRYPHQIFTGEKLCQACGLSVYISEKDILWARKSVPGMRKKLIVKANLAALAAEFGKLKDTPSATSSPHYTWWVPENVQPWELFTWELFAIIEK